MGKHKMRLLSAPVPLLVTCFLGRTDAEVVGTINVEGVGTIYVWKSFGDIVIEDNGFRVRGNSRGYLLSKDPGGSLTPDAFWQTNLFDQHFVYDLNLSGVGCHCNAAAYFIKMPSPYGPGDSNDYYCEWGGDWFNNCDMGGFGSSSWVGGVPYGPGQMINSDNEFWVSNYQNNDIANTYMEQNGQGAAFNICDQGWYMPVMGNHYPAMVFSMSLWGGPGIDMGWMDGITGCGGGCNIDGSTFTMKNFKLGDYSERIQEGLARTAANYTMRN